jgi:SAM-dependent methyltransferase
MELKEKKCICNKANDTLLYPQRIDWSRFSSYEFSARRQRRIQHYRIVRCNNCGLVRSDPVLSEDSLALLYKDCKFLYKDESRIAATAYASLARSYFKPLPGQAKRSLLEVGCGDGAFLEEMMNAGIDDIVGLEPTVDALNFASDRVRPHIVNDIFKPGRFEVGTFDMICVFHVLDHLSSPDEFIKESWKILKKGGMVLLVCHDVDAIVNKILMERSPVFDIEHIFLFNKSTLKALAENNGFEVIGAGDLRNTYKISYWLKYTPVLNRIVPFLPGMIKNRFLTLSAGNIFICAQKK